MINNCTIAMVLNIKILFVGPIEKVNNVRIVIVRGNSYYPTYKGIAYSS